MELVAIIISFLIFAILCIKQLNWGLVVIAALLPTYLIRFKIGSVPFTFLEGMILIVVAFWIIREIQNKNLGKKIKRLPKCKFFLPGILFFTAATISVFVSPDLKAAAGIWKAYFLEPLLLFLVFINVVQSKKQLRAIVWALGLSALFISTVALIQYFTGLGIPESYNLPGMKRSTSIYGYPGAIGLYVGPILVLFLGLLIKAKTFFTKRTSFLGLLAIILAIFGLLTAKAEGAIIGVLTATLFIFMFTKWRRWVILATLILICVTFSIPQTRDYVLTLITFQDVSGDVRLALWQGTWRLIKAHPIFGTGLAGFPTFYEQYKEAKHVEISLYPHNIVFNFWTETGLLGLIAFFWIVINFFRGGKKQSLKFKAKSQKFKVQNSKFIIHGPKLSAIPLLGVMICILVHGFVDVPYFKNDLSVLFWIFVGLLTAANND